MGTDIHAVFQKKTETGWETIPSNFQEERHYFLFGWLGDVRNGTGFAGIATGEPVEPVAAHRGLPDDFEMSEDHDGHVVASKELLGRRAEYHEDGEPLVVWMGDHSHSWATADEILNHPLPETERTGVITLAQFRQWEGQKPDTYSEGIMGPNIKVSSPDDIDESTTHVQVYWKEKSLDSLRYFIDEVRRLKELHGEVRMVFGFDS